MTDERAAEIFGDAVWRHRDGRWELVLYEKPMGCLPGYPYKRWYRFAFISDTIYYHASKDASAVCLRTLLNQLTDDQAARALMAPWINFDTLTRTTTPTETSSGV